MSRIEEIIDEMQKYLDDCKFQPLSNSKLLVNKDDIEAFLDDLKNETPDEIRKYQKIIGNRDAIMEDAQNKADDLIAQTKIRVNEMASEHEIMRQASAQASEVVAIATGQAQEILDKATEDANNIRTAAIEYTDSLLSSLQEIVANGLSASRSHYEELDKSLSDCLSLLEKNRAELSPREAAEAADDEGGISIM